MAMSGLMNWKLPPHHMSERVSTQYSANAPASVPHSSPAEATPEISGSRQLSACCTRSTCDAASPSVFCTFAACPMICLYFLNGLRVCPPAFSSFAFFFFFLLLFLIFSSSSSSPVGAAAATSSCPAHAWYSSGRVGVAVTPVKSRKAVTSSGTCHSVRSKQT